MHNIPLEFVKYIYSNKLNVFSNYDGIGFFKPFLKRQNLRLVEIESICRQQTKCFFHIMYFLVQRVGNIVGKGEKIIMVISIFPFSHNVFCNSKLESFQPFLTLRTQIQV